MKKWLARSVGRVLRGYILSAAALGVALKAFPYPSMLRIMQRVTRRSSDTDSSVSGDAHPVREHFRLTDYGGGEYLSCQIVGPDVICRPWKGDRKLSPDALRQLAAFLITCANKAEQPSGTRLSAPDSAAVARPKEKLHANV